MVAERVEVSTRRAGESEGWKLSSDGRGAFTIAPDGEAPARGTRIVLHLREGEEAYLDPSRIRRIAATYSNPVSVPVVLESEQVDQADETFKAAYELWTRPKRAITSEKQTALLHHRGH